MGGAEGIARRILEDPVVSLDLLAEAGLAKAPDSPDSPSLDLRGLGRGALELEIRYLACYRMLESGRNSVSFSRHDKLGLDCLRAFLAHFDISRKSLSDLGDADLEAWRLFSAFFRDRQRRGDPSGYLASLKEAADRTGTGFGGMPVCEVLERTTRLVEASMSLASYDVRGCGKDPLSADAWRIDEVAEFCGMRYNESLPAHTIILIKIRNLELRDLAKAFLRARLTRGKRISTSSASHYATYLTRFMAYVDAEVPDGIGAMTRGGVERFLYGYLGGESLQNGMLGCLRSLFKWLQRTEHPHAPKTPAHLLILRSDYTKRTDSSAQDKEMPGYVLAQLAAHWDELDEDIRCLVDILNKAGLRISDALQLEAACLELEEDGWWLLADIEKIPADRHRIPIDDELADRIREFAARDECSDPAANPRRFLFVNPDAKRKGGPWRQDEMRSRLNEILARLGVKDENGEAFSFHFHGMRHRYAMGILNSGGSIVDVADLLGHRSGSMAAVYAHLTEDRKRDVFRSAVERGMFSFAEDGVEVTLSGTDISDALLDALWANAKLLARDTPYGVCVARKGALCPNADEPPCLTIAGGSPCPHLAVGLSEMDVVKYEALCSSSEELRIVAEKHGGGFAETARREEGLYVEILDKLKEGAVIVGASLLFPQAVDGPGEHLIDGIIVEEALEDVGSGAAQV